MVIFSNFRECYNHEAIIDNVAIDEFPSFEQDLEKEKLTVHKDDEFPFI